MYNMQLLVAGLISLFFVAFISATPFEKCIIKGDEKPSPIEVIAHCGETLPCPLPQGTNANVNITFDIPSDVETGTIDIKALLYGMEVPFYPPDNNLCHALLNAYCPLDKGERITYHMLLPILKYYPPLKLKLRISFTDDRNATLACFEMQTVVVKQQN